MDQNPILKSPYDDPEFHFATNLADGSLDYRTARVTKEILLFRFENPRTLGHQ